MKSGVRIIRHMMPIKFEDAVKRDKRDWQKSEWEKPTNKSHMIELYAKKQAEALLSLKVIIDRARKKC